MIQEEVIVDNNQVYNVNQSKNMNEFITEAKVQGEEQYFEQIQNESFTKTNVVRPDNADEESMQGVIIEALAH